MSRRQDLVNARKQAHDVKEQCECCMYFTPKACCQFIRETILHLDKVLRPVLCCSNAETRVVVDGKVVTSRGPGTSLEFALSLVKQLFGKQKADEVAGPMVISQGLEY